MDRRLAELRAAQPEVEIETVDVLANPARAVRDGVWMIPALIVGGKRWYHAPPLAELQAVLHDDS